MYDTKLFLPTKHIDKSKNIHKCSCQDYNDIKELCPNNLSLARNYKTHNNDNNNK